jgi:hypothetical protein
MRGEREAGVARTGGGDWRAARRRIGCGLRGGLPGGHVSGFPRIQSMAAAPSEGQEPVRLKAHATSGRTSGWGGTGAWNKLMAPVGRIHASRKKCSLSLRS